MAFDESNSFRTGTDRTNIVETENAAKNVPLNMRQSRFFQDMDAYEASSGNKLTWSNAAYKLATSNRRPNNNNNNDIWLNNAPASYRGIVARFKEPSVRNLLCTRNNNFSNRSQKATITIRAGRRIEK